MRKDEFMKQLEYLLSDIPEDEKRDALQYYRDYLDDAGDEEERVIREFGSPERIASIIRSELQGSLKDGGQFTDTGYTDERFREPNYQVVAQGTRPDERKPDNAGPEKADGKGMTFMKAVVIIAVILLAMPILLGVGGGALGILAGVLGVLFGLIVLLAVMTLALFVAAAAVLVYGVVHLFSDLLVGVMCIGIGLILLAFGLLVLLLAVLFYGKFLPWLVRGCVDLVNHMFHKNQAA